MGIPTSLPLLQPTEGVSALLDLPEEGKMSLLPIKTSYSRKFVSWYGKPRVGDTCCYDVSKVRIAVPLKAQAVSAPIHSTGSQARLLRLGPGQDLQVFVQPI